MGMKVIHRQPKVEEYHELRVHVGWGVPVSEATTESIKNSLFSVCLEKGNSIIGLGRIVGDGGLYYYIQDVIVLEQYRGRGYSQIIMDELMEYLRLNAKQGSFIGLFSAKGVEELYAKYGFIERPTKQFGPGMFIPLERLLTQNKILDNTGICQSAVPLQAKEDV